MMYDFTLVEEYLKSVAYTDIYLEKSEEERKKLVFTAYDRLLNYFSERYLTPKVIGLQTVYMIEGEEDEYALLKRHNLKTIVLKGMNLTFDEAHQISPDVLEIIQRSMDSDKPRGARVGRLI